MQPYRYLTIIFLLLVSIAAKAFQHNVLVVDSVSRDGVPYAAIFVEGTKDGTLTDDTGRAVLQLKKNRAQLKVSVLGYETAVVEVDSRDTLSIIKLRPVGVALKEVVVKKKREHYSKRNNPAVDLMEKVRAHGKLSNPKKRDYYTFDKYEKIAVALNDYSHGAAGVLDKAFKFLGEYVDTSEVTNKPILNISVKERQSTVFNRADPTSTKEVIKASKRVGVDDFVDQKGVQTFLNDVLREVDIYDDDINILRNRFVSPLSHIAAEFYKFYLSDSIGTGRDKIMELSFVPRVSATFGFTGKFYIHTGDSTYFIERAVMSVPRDINLNFVESLDLRQSFDRMPDGTRLKLTDDLTLEMAVVAKTPGLYVRRTAIRTGHNFEKPLDLSMFDAKEDVIETAEQQFDNEYWEMTRPVAISRGEDNVGSLVVRLRNHPVYYWGERTLKVLVNGYVHTGKPSLFDIGPVNTLISANDVEGARFRVGGMTTGWLSHRWFGRGYVAYGTKDKKFKYSGEVEYSFVDKEYHSREFPVHSLRFTQKYDMDMIGQKYSFTNPDNVFLSLKRMKNELMTYQRSSELLYTRESMSNLSITAALRQERQEASRYIPFVTMAGEKYDYYDQAYAKLCVRYAPGEKFYQTKTKRMAVNYDAPIFLLEHSYGPRKWLGSRYELNKTELSVQKRVWLSAFGYVDCLVRGGHVWSSTSFPALLIPNANLSYTIQPESFALLNPMEFITDTYGMVNLTYWANGAILNYVPGLRWFKLREVFGFKGFLGSLSDLNRPAVGNDLFAFPASALATDMKGRPYMEMSVGLDNVLKCLRIDYVWRLSYKNTPGVDRNGVRIAFHVSF